MLRSTAPIATAALAFALAAPAGAGEGAARPPNIVLILADDLGYADLGCQGCRDVPTPHIDSLAGGGIRCTAGYVTCPVCSPTRAGLLTGRYGQRFGHEFNPGPVLRGRDQPGLPLAEKTLADRLKSLGYATALVGKWHLGSDAARGPLRRGFDEFFGFLGGMHPYRGDDPANRILRGTAPVEEKEYLTGAFTREAIAFIDRNRSRPFFLYLAYNAVHLPLEAAPRGEDRFAGIADPRRRTFATMLAALDDGVGAVLAKLAGSGLEKDTLVFFLSDNGGITPRNTSRNDPLRGTKGQVWEGGIRVPWIVRWPARLPAGKVYDLAVSSLDVVPTALAAAGSPAAGEAAIDGVDLLPHLSGAIDRPPHESLFWRFGAQAAVRQGDWKLVKMGDRPPQLFDLKGDIGESRDVAGERPERAEKLRQDLERWSAGLAEPLWGPAGGAGAGGAAGPKAAAGKAARAGAKAAGKKARVAARAAGKEARAAGKAAGKAAEGRLRVIVETDAGGDPDDEQSLVRFLLYADEWDVEGIIANRARARDGENLNRERTGLGIVRAAVKAYGECCPNLVLHDPRYPPPERLLARTVAGHEDVDDGVGLVIAAADSPDSRPVWFLNWGTDHGSAPSCLRRALDRVLRERGRDGYAAFKRRFRLSSYDAFGPHTAEIEPPWEIWVDTFRPEKDGKRWYHRFSAMAATAGGFDLRRDVLEGHGPLGALYPTNTTHPQKEGDTMCFLYLVPTGMNDPEHPEWGSWAGRYAPQPAAAGRRYFWADAADAWQGTTHRDNTLRRWAADFQDDFRARLDWCVRDFAHANHPPEPRVEGPLERTAAAGEEVALDASGSSDPDGNRLRFEWAFYPEAGSYRGPLPAIRGADSPRASFAAPPVDAPRTIHVILTVADAGDPPLARYRRVIVTVVPAGGGGEAGRTPR